MGIFGSNARYSLLNGETTNDDGRRTSRYTCFTTYIHCIWARPRSNKILLGPIVICTSLILAYLFLPSSHVYRSNAAPFNKVRIIPPPPLTTSGPLEHVQTDDNQLHVLLPASNTEVNLCKTLLGLSVLGYPNPSLIGWGEDPGNMGLLGGGTHLNKITLVLEYLSNLRPEQDNDLVFMLDAYDIWLQLPPSTFISRYHAVVQRTQAELIQRVGKAAVDDENLYTSIIFGAGKRCAPNQHHEVACFAVPESGLPDDLYGPDTDTVIGYGLRSSHRQRSLNSGYIIGPVADMRRLFQEAQRIMDEHPHEDPIDNGSHGSDDHYHGSDQSIFAKIFGRQEWVREHHRIRHVSIWDRLSHPFQSPTKPRSSKIYSLFVDNILQPSFSHEQLDPSFADHPYEFGITLDYWSDFGVQEIHSEFDGRWLVYGNDQPGVTSMNPSEHPKLIDQIGEPSAFHCKTALPPGLPVDITSSTSEVVDTPRWTEVGLYTNICLSRIPIMLHHNGDKSTRVRDWHRVWYVADGKARQLLSSVARTRSAGGPNEGLKGRSEHIGCENSNIAPCENALQSESWESDEIHKTRQDTTPLSVMVVAQTPKQPALTWRSLCQVEWDNEIFRDQS